LNTKDVASWQIDISYPAFMIYIFRKACLLEYLLVRIFIKLKLTDSSTAVSL
jgi:hypothetical protein